MSERNNTFDEADHNSKELFKKMRKSIWTKYTIIGVLATTSIWLAITYFPYPDHSGTQAIILAVATSFVAAIVVSAIFELNRVRPETEENYRTITVKSLVDILNNKEGVLEKLSKKDLINLRRNSTSADLEVDISNKNHGLFEACMREVTNRISSIHAERTYVERIYEKHKSGNWKISVKLETTFANATSQNRDMPVYFFLISESITDEFNCTPEEEWDDISTNLTLHHHEAIFLRTDGTEDIERRVTQPPEKIPFDELKDNRRKWEWKPEKGYELRPGEVCIQKISYTFYAPETPVPSTQSWELPRKAVRYRAIFKDEPPLKLATLRLIGCSLCGGQRKVCFSDDCKEDTGVVNFCVSDDGLKYELDVTDWVGSDISIELKW